MLIIKKLLLRMMYLCCFVGRCWLQQSRTAFSKCREK